MNPQPYVDKIGLGTVQFGLSYGIGNAYGQTKREEVTQILSYAESIGINTLDTAYGYGSAEDILGENNIDNFHVVSKFSLQHASEINIVQSLNKLNIKALYGYLSHSPLEVFRKLALWDQMQEIKDRGLTKKIGFSLNTLEEAHKLLDLGLEPDLIQIPFNYFDSRFQELSIELKEKYGTEIHSRSSFLQGIFFRKIDELSAYFNPLKPEIKRIQNLQEPVANLLLKYCLNQDWIDKTIIGVNNLAQLKENIMGLNMDSFLTANEFNFREELITPSFWPKTI